MVLAPNVHVGLACLFSACRQSSLEAIGWTGESRARETMRRTTAGIRIITIYKLAKAPIVICLALWLSVAPSSAFSAGEDIAREISEGGATLARVAHWLERHLTAKFAVDAALIAWVDGVTTAIEGLLLLQGSAWAEWVVVVALGILVPFEAVSLEQHPGAVRLGVLVVNALIVAYLALDRLRGTRKEPT